MTANMESNSKAPHGVYKNPRLMHVCTTIVGSVVHLETKDGPIWEGLFNTFSPEFTICLDLAVQIDPKLNSKDCLYAALKSGSEAKQKAFFDLKDIVRITVIDVDLNYATKDLEKLTTDNDISGFDPNKLGKNRELESWEDYDGDDPNDESLLSLDDVAAAERKNNSGIHNNSHGWGPEEMFEYNKQVHKVSSTYDDKLSNYTIQLESKNNSKEWRKKSEKAAAIAKEIEGNTKSQSRLAKEDGSDCEEEKFSAVVRPQNISPPQTQMQSQQPPQQQPHHHQQSQQLQQQQHHHQHPHHQQHQPMQHHHQQQQRPMSSRLNPGNQNGTHKNFRPRFTDKSRLDSLKNFQKQLTIATSPRQPISPAAGLNQQQSPHQQSQLKPNKQIPHTHTPPYQQSNQQSHQPHQSQPQQSRPQTQSHHIAPPSIPPQASQTTHDPHPQHQHPQHQQPQHTPQHPSNHNHYHQHPPQQQQQQQQAQPHQQQPTIITPQSNQQSKTPPQTQSVPTTTVSQTTATSTASTDTSAAIEGSDNNSSIGSTQSKDPSEIARNSTLNPDAKEFVYKPRSPASVHGAQTNGANPALGGQAIIEPANSSPMSQTSHGPYYQQVPIFPHGLSPQQPHHPAHFMPNHAHLQFQNHQIHYMPPPVAPHFAAQQMSPRYIRGNFQNYHHRNGEHNNVRAAYSQASMIAPTSSGQQPYVPSPSGAPHPINAYPGSPQQPMIYSGPPQSMYPMVQPAGFPQHMPQHMPNPPYDGSAVYMPQNYIVNPQQ